MAFKTGNIAKMTFNGLDISAYVQSIDINAKRDIKDLPRLGGNQTAHLPGPVSVEIKIEGWYDPVIGTAFGSISLSTALTAYGWEAELYGTGAESYSGSAYIGGFNPSVDSEEPDKFSVTLAPDENGVTFSAT